MENEDNKDYHKELLVELGLLKQVVYGTGGEPSNNNFKDLYNEKKHKKRKLKFMK